MIRLTSGSLLSFANAALEGTCAATGSNAMRSASAPADTSKNVPNPSAEACIDSC